MISDSLTELAEERNVTDNNPLIIQVSDIRTDGNISMLGEVFFEIPSGIVNVELNITFVGQQNPIIIQVNIY